MAKKLSIAGIFTFFLLVAAGVAISSNDTATQITYADKPGFDAAVHHVFYGLNLALVAVLGVALGLVMGGLILALAVASVLLAADRVIKPLNAIESKMN